MPNDPLVGGSILRRPAIASPDYTPGSAGWTINADGTAEFNSLDVRGTFMGADYELNANGMFFYIG